MAYMTLLVTVMMAAVVSAGFSSWNNNGFSGMPTTPNFTSMFNFPSLHQPPGFMGMPSMPFPWPGSNFPNLPPPPPLPTVQSIIATMPTVQSIEATMPRLPTVDDIASQGAVPGSNYNGAAIFTQSSSERGGDGKIRRRGGSTIVTNDNGQVTVQQSGNSPPVVVTQYTNPSFPDFPEFDNAKNFKAPTFKIPTMKPFPFKMPEILPIDPESIRNFVPDSNEQYQGSYKSASSYSSNVNGVKTIGGKIISLENDNGKVNEENIGFHKGPE